MPRRVPTARESRGALGQPARRRSYPDGENRSQNSYITSELSGAECPGVAREPVVRPRTRPSDGGYVPPAGVSWNVCSDRAQTIPAASLMWWSFLRGAGTANPDALRSDCDVRSSSSSHNRLPPDLQRFFAPPSLLCQPAWLRHAAGSPNPGRYTPVRDCGWSERSSAPLLIQCSSKWAIGKRILQNRNYDIRLTKYTLQNTNCKSYI